VETEIIKRVASTARIQLSDAEIAEFSKEMDSILKHFAEIKNVKTDEEMYYVYDTENPLRKDEKGTPGNAIGIRDQFTKKEGKHLSAPKSIKR